MESDLVSFGNGKDYIPLSGGGGGCCAVLVGEGMFFLTLRPRVMPAGLLAPGRTLVMLRCRPAAGGAGPVGEVALGFVRSRALSGTGNMVFERARPAARGARSSTGFRGAGTVALRPRGASPPVPVEGDGSLVGRSPSGAPFGVMPRFRRVTPVNSV